MGKNKVNKLKNKDALDFILVNRGMDDPNYQNPDATPRVLLHVPKDEGEVTKEHQKILKQIPEINRGVYTDKVMDDQLREMGIKILNKEDDLREIKKNIDELNKENFVKQVKIDLSKNEIVNYEKNSRPKHQEEEMVDTTLKSKSVSNNKDELDDKKIDELLKNAKISAEITEYNKFGLRKDIDPEVLNYITTKEFVEGVDIFIPAPDGTPIEQNRFDTDIPFEKMNAEYKEVHEAMKSEDEENVEELEDDFILLANEGVLPIEIDAKPSNNNTAPDEMVITETTNKTKSPSYKFITKEEKDFLDKQFKKTLKEYSEDNSNANKVKATYVSKAVFEDAMNELIGAKKTAGKKDKIMGLTPKFDDEDEYEDYELDEEGEFDELVGEEGEEIEDDDEDKDKDKENETEKKTKEDQNKVEFCENNFKIEYEDKKQNKKGSQKVKTTKDLENFTIEDVDNLIHDENFIAKTIELFENTTENPKEDEEGIPIYYPKKTLDITTVHGKVGYLPKTIGVPNVKYTKGTMPRTEADNSTKHSGNTIAVSTSKHAGSVPFNPEEESKEQKKLRKQLVKEDKKEKRKQKKELKAAFKHEKCKLMKQIADTNQVIRYGLSVKEI